MWVWVRVRRSGFRSEYVGLGPGMWVWVRVYGSGSGFGYVGLGPGMWVWIQVQVCGSRSGFGYVGCFRDYGGRFRGREIQLRGKGIEALG
jgi:hypothetical protein